MFTMRPAGPCLSLSVPKRGAKALHDHIWSNDAPRARGLRYTLAGVGAARSLTLWMNSRRAADNFSGASMAT